MKNVMKRALALMLGLVITLATAETSVAYAAPGHYQGSYSYSNYFTKKHAHVFNRAVTEKWTEATCDSYATQTWACSQYVTKNGVKVLCEEEVTVISGNKLPHNYVSTATEESEGVYQCACGAVEYEMCKNCAEYRIFGRYHVPHMITKVAPKLPHTHVEVTDAAVEATCTTTGLTEGSHCGTCGEVLVAQEAVEATGHAWDEGEIRLAATCEHEGVTKYTCMNCGEEKFVDTAIAAHTWATVAAKDATCTENGYEAYEMCTVCGFHGPIYSIDAIGHDVVVDAAVEATCTTTGLTEGSHCGTCGEVLVAQEVIPMEEHAWYVTKEYSYCEIEGTRYYKCEAKCGAFKEEVVAPLGHNKATVAAVEATCTEDGHTEYTMCTTCGNSWGYVVIPATGHTEVVVPGYAATCKKAGLTDGKNCSTCGEVLVAQEVIDASAEYHDWVATSSDDPCSLNPGETKLVTYRCSVCNRGMGKEISYAPHTYGTVAAKAPTCTEAGYKEYTMCTTCGIHWYYEEIPATGHVVVVDSEAVAAIGTQHGWSQASHCGTCNEVLEERKEVCAWAADVADCPYGCMKAK